MLPADRAAALLAAGEFPAGSMGPKIEAALTFLAGGGREVVITAPEDRARGHRRPRRHPHRPGLIPIRVVRPPVFGLPSRQAAGEPSPHTQEDVIPWP